MALFVSFLALGGATAKASDAWISIEVVTAQGVQPTAQRELIETLTNAGADNVRLRGHQAGDKVELRTTGTDERPRYALIGVLDARGNLTLPGGKFNARSRSQLQDYFDRLGADGAEGVTAPRGKFGLTEKQTHVVRDDLTKMLGVETKGRPLPDVLKDADKVTGLRLNMDDSAWKIVREAKPVDDDVQMLTTGTALALLLKRDGLVLVPTKERGEEVVHRIARAADIEGDVWPVGWKPRRAPSQLAPKMMENLNAQVEGFTLQEAMDSIAPRLGLPVFWDHATLRAKKIVPSEIDVKLALQQTYLKRVADKLLFQARLRGELKVDEAGTPFYWISR
ncbi:hypothetical protein NG895_21610 [Aeoliella sp. ICT_H6.2]|uniref:Uncharacterized protein n=1 Tax=Aeoliella straminimaris TaxID=2954799 RepID=A0A9X2FCL6_9BACT|nr:hypothetical protein [Aeoliella straminimaris]MCO6046505.1 hypothetical protein [Aeoliella straminimaris]